MSYEVTVEITDTDADHAHDLVSVEGSAAILDGAPVTARYLRLVAVAGNITFTRRSFRAGMIGVKEAAAEMQLWIGVDRATAIRMLDPHAVVKLS
jgi:hypothetical protein